MHFNPASSHESLPSDCTSRVEPDEYDEIDGPEQIEGPERVDEESAAPPARPGSASAPRREGLPPSFRMRHQRHYVEQLMGDAPIRTVRDIAVADIEPPHGETPDLLHLEESIRRMGVIQPLLVSQQGSRYQVITGANRLRAARNAGLNSVPCIVHDADEEMVKNMREAATQRAVPPPPPPPAAEEAGGLPPAFSEVTAGLQFVSALLPAITAAEGDRFRRSVLTDLAGIELLRARTVAAAAEALADAPALDREEVDCGGLVRSIVSALDAESRLRGVRVDVETQDGEYRMPLDAGLVRTAITGLIQGLFAVVPHGAAIRVQVKGTSVRPALIVQVSQDAVDLDEDALRRFFDGRWREHPAGGAGALVSAGAARVARLHGGRVDMLALPMRGCLITFVIPRPLQ